MSGTSAALRTTPEALEQLDNEALMALYKETGSAEAKWTLVLRFQDLIRRIAVGTCGMYQNFTQLDDVVQEGVLTLLGAVDRFDPSLGIKLETFVAKRIRGMIIDMGRKQDWLPRQLRQTSTRINRAVEELSVELGHLPEDREVAARLGVSLEEYEKMLSETAGANLLSFEMLLDTYGSAADGMMETAGDPSQERCEQRELQEALARAIGALDHREQLVLSLYYERELTMKEIAEVLDISAPRVSQLHSRAITRLRLTLQDYL